MFAEGVLNAVIQNLFTLDVLIALLVGVCLGMVIGAMPGLSGTMAIALLLPITYSMDAAPALIMLMAIYTSAMTGGSISAILLHTPGTPGNAATAIEGYPMTKQGRGLEALGISMLSSTFGGVLSAIALLLIAPPLAKVSLLFSEPENFLVAIFGLTIIGSLAGEDMIKGLLCGAIGLALATVGIDNISGTLRFAFGQNGLYSGIQMVPAMIGLFSIPRVLAVCEKPKEANKSLALESDTSLSGRLFLSGKEYKRLLPVALMSSIIGTFVGILPGAGGSIGSWMSYDRAKRMSKHKEEFGNGSIEGLCACETGNNAVTGGAFIPLLTLAIPGSPAAAVCLGALMIQGLVPGNRLFTQQAATTYTILFGFLIANILMGIFGLLISKYAVKVTAIPNSILMPCVLVLCFIGSYAINASMFDVYVAVGFGVIGYLMEKLKLPAAPLILGLILGSTAETGFRLSLVMANGNPLVYYFSRPVCIILMVIIVATIAAPIISSMMKKKNESAAL